MKMAAKGYQSSKLIQAYDFKLPHLGGALQCRTESQICRHQCGHSLQLWRKMTLVVFLVPVFKFFCKGTG